MLKVVVRRNTVIKRGEQAFGVQPVVRGPGDFGLRSKVLQNR